MDKLESCFNLYLKLLQQTAANSSNGFKTAIASNQFWDTRLVSLGKGLAFDGLVRISALAGIIISIPLAALTAIPYIATHLLPVRLLPQSGVLRDHLYRVLNLEMIVVKQSLIASIAPFYLSGRKANTTVQAIINFLKTHSAANTIERMIALLLLKKGETPTSLNQKISLEELVDEGKKNTGGYTSVYCNAILSSLFSANNEAVAVREDGKLMHDKGKFYKTAYCLDVGNRYTPEASWDYIAPILTELFKHTDNHKRIGKIFLPLAWSDKGTGHEVLLVIEPNNGAPRITLLNTHGDSLTKFKHYEDYLLEKLNSFFGASTTPTLILGATIFKNKKTIYSTAYSCGPDIMHIIDSLKDCPNIQERIKQGLPRLSNEDSQQTRKRHAELVSALSRRYLAATAA